jgi:hypothetical protein
VADDAALTRRQDRHGLDDARGRTHREEERGGREHGDDGGEADDAPYPRIPVGSSSYAPTNALTCCEPVPAPVTRITGTPIPATLLGRSRRSQRDR